MDERPYRLSRDAFTPREVARAGDVWRLFQDIAVEGSSAAGWPPSRYRDEGVSFVVRSMVAVHHREIVYGEPIIGRTWPSAFRRGMFFRRECRASVGGALVASATQEWVHVRADGQGVTLAKASDALADAFAVEDHDAPVGLPAIERIDDAREHRFAFDTWTTWMDPLGHVNHPQYIDFADEALARAVAAAGIDPHGLVPRAEEARFRAATQAGDRVDVRTTLSGCTDDAVAFDHRIERDGQLLATVRAVRSLDGLDRDALLALR